MTSPAIPGSSLQLVPDAGFYVAAALYDGYARNYLVGRGPKFLTYELVTSEAILHQVQVRLEDTFGLDRPRVVSLLRQLRKLATIVHPTHRVHIMPNPLDNAVLEAALEAKANFAVSLTYELLQLATFESTQITHPSLLPRILPALSRSFPRQEQAAKLPV